MKRVGLEEIGDTPVPAPTGDLGAQLAHMMTGLNDIAAIKEDYNKIMGEHAMMNKQIVQLLQYQKDHDELHRNMSEMHSKKSAELEKAVAQAITASQQDLRTGIQAQGDQLQVALESQRLNMMATLAVVQKAMEDLSGKEISITLPEQNIQLEQPAHVLLDYKIIRKGNLLDTIREVKQQ